MYNTFKTHFLLFQDDDNPGDEEAETKVGDLDDTNFTAFPDGEFQASPDADISHIGDSDSDHGGSYMYGRKSDNNRSGKYMYSRKIPEIYREDEHGRRLDDDGQPISAKCFARSGGILSSIPNQYNCSGFQIDTDFLRF